MKDTTKMSIKEIILEVLQNNQVRTQEQLAELMKPYQEYPLNQSTISRYLREMGIRKHKASGRYLVNRDQIKHEEEQKLRELLAKQRLFTGELVVLKTEPGHAEVVATKLKQMHPSKVLGTVAQHDTIFVAATGIFATKLRNMFDQNSGEYMETDDPDLV